MEYGSFLDWLLNWKTTLFLSSGCFGVAIAVFGLSFHRDLASIRQDMTRVAAGMEKTVEELRKANGIHDCPIISAKEDND